jgi:hypothetical protein
VEKKRKKGKKRDIGKTMCLPMSTCKEIYVESKG